MTAVPETQGGAALSPTRRRIALIALALGGFGIGSAEFVSMGLLPQIAELAEALRAEGVDRVVQVNVSDNGRGIDPGVSRRSGLANMSSRARRHAGWVDAFNLEPGTMISWRVTLPPS